MLVKPPLDSQNPSEDAMLHHLQENPFDYFLHESNLESGLILDKPNQIGPWH